MHVARAINSVDLLTRKPNEPDFLDYFAQAYKLHSNWCESIKRLA